MSKRKRINADGYGFTRTGDHARIDTRSAAQTATDRGSLGDALPTITRLAIVGAVDRPGPRPAAIDSIDDASEPTWRERRRLEPRSSGPGAARDRYIVAGQAAQTRVRMQYGAIAGLTDQSATKVPMALELACKDLLPPQWGTEIQRWLIQLRERLGYAIEASRDRRDCTDLDRYGVRVRRLRDFDRRTVEDLLGSRHASVIVAKAVMDEATKWLADELGISWIPPKGWDSPDGPVVDRNAEKRDEHLLAYVAEHPGLTQNKLRQGLRIGVHEIRAALGRLSLRKCLEAIKNPKGRGFIYRVIER